MPTQHVTQTLNRTTLELKSLEKAKAGARHASKSHHTGIEIRFCILQPCGVPALNRTTLELKQGGLPIGVSGARRVLNYLRAQVRVNTGCR